LNAVTFIAITCIGLTSNQWIQCR